MTKTCSNAIHQLRMCDRNDQKCANETYGFNDGHKKMSVHKVRTFTKKVGQFFNVPLRQV